ncbi:MAG: hypothetical protein U0175_39700 [Caldilineaceae bacterium]
MKTIIRIVIILAAAMLVVGVTYALGQRSSSTQGFSPRFGELRSNDAGGSTNREFRPNREFEGRGFEGRRGGQAFGFRGLAGFTQTLLPITAVIAIVAIIDKAWKRRKRPQKVIASAGP